MILQLRHIILEYSGKHNNKKLMYEYSKRTMFVDKTLYFYIVRRKGSLYGCDRQYNYERTSDVSYSYLRDEKFELSHNY